METIQKKRIILSHSGKQHAYHVAKALYDLDCLETFYTSSYISNIGLQRLIQTLNLSFLSRRFLNGLGGKQVHASWRYEIKELIYRKLKGNTQEVNDLVFERDIKFDKDLSKKLAGLSNDTFWGFQGSCHACLQASNNLGLETICEMTIAHLPYAKRILQEEAKLQPDWADSIDFMTFPGNYEKRLIEEPLMAKKVIAISSFLKETLVQEGVKAEKITVIPLGFDADAISYSEKKESITNRPLRLLYAGKITQRKGIKYLLDAINQFDKRDVELHVIGNVYGSGKAFQSYKSSYNYKSGITQQELFRLYGQYDALVFPSILEGFGLVTVEAMGAGLPVITTPNTNATEVIKDNVNGYLVPIRSSEAIVQGITKLRNMDDATFQQMRWNARQTALQYTWAVHRGKVDQFIADFT
jgi:glycosyltransferase involved in cell wall biosynthesis